MSITASEAARSLPKLIEQVNDDAIDIGITSRHGSAVLMSKSEYDSLREFEHLMRHPANARELLDSMRQAQNGEYAEHELDRS
jgi:antitoxin YefM